MARYGTVVNPGVGGLPSRLKHVIGDPDSPSGLVFGEGRQLPGRGATIVAAPSRKLPSGLVVRVTAVRRQGADRVLLTAPVPILEAVPAFDVRGEVPMRPRHEPKTSSSARSTALRRCDGPNLFDYGGRLDEFTLRRASASSWPPQMSFTVAVRPRLWFGAKAVAAGVSCEWKLVSLPHWQGFIPTPIPGVAIPVFASIPVDAKAIVEGSLEAFRLNVASTSVLDLKLGNTNRFGFHQEGSNVWVDGVMKVSGSAELSATVKLKMGVGNPNIGDLHVSAGFGPRARWSSGACGVNLDLGSFSAGARIWKLKVGTPSWSPFSINLWKDCRAEDGSSGGASSGGGSGGGAPSGGAPGGTFTAITAGANHNCGVRADATAVCWGSNAHGQTNTPASTFSQISAGSFHTCALRENGTAMCWGLDSHGQSSPPSGAFTQISAGGNHTCALRAGGAAVCWGSNVSGESSPPSGAFTTVRAGGAHTCGLRTDGSVVCWGNTFGDPPGGAFSGIGAGAAHTCGLKADGTAVCWGYNSDGQASPPGGTFSEISGGSLNTCGLRTDGTAVCWGNDSHGQSSPPSGHFVQISVGATHACALRTDGTAVCWGFAP